MLKSFYNYAKVTFCEVSLQVKNYRGLVARKSMSFFSFLFSFVVKWVFFFCGIPFPFDSDLEEDDVKKKTKGKEEVVVKKESKGKEEEKDEFLFQQKSVKEDQVLSIEGTNTYVSWDQRLSLIEKKLACPEMSESSFADMQEIHTSILASLERLRVTGSLDSEAQRVAVEQVFDQNFPGYAGGETFGNFMELFNGDLKKAYFCLTNEQILPDNGSLSTFFLRIDHLKNLHGGFSLTQENERQVFANMAQDLIAWEDSILEVHPSSEDLVSQYIATILSETEGLIFAFPITTQIFLRFSLITLFHYFPLRRCYNAFFIFSVKAYWKRLCVFFKLGDKK